tara:strand:+ start:147 stop:1208 length:1062 start_codon:yes stop_codon:yes gene_type:complete
MVDSIPNPGLIALFGSGEIAPSGRKVYDHIFGQISTSVNVSIWETPAGFQPNSAIVAGKIGQFLESHLRNHKPIVNQVPLRRIKGSSSSVLKKLMGTVPNANVIFLGPGSPTYTVRQLKNSFAWDVLTQKHNAGTHLVLASAATIAMGKYALPVYEIYKSGETLHWTQGLDLLGTYGLNITFIPHWNNLEGGNELDTSHCYMGAQRFKQLSNLLEVSTTVVGIDEHTALIINMKDKQCHVVGKGSVTIISHRKKPRIFTSGSFSISELGQLSIPKPRRANYKSALPWLTKLQTHTSLSSQPSKMVLDTCASREQARKTGNWALADLLRNQIQEMGWRVTDTEEGSKLIPYHSS